MSSIPKGLLPPSIDEPPGGRLWQGGHHALFPSKKRWDEEMASNCTRGGLDLILEMISPLTGLSRTGIGCPKKWLNGHTRRYLKDVAPGDIV